jgi:hypothetical protein
MAQLKRTKTSADLWLLYIGFLTALASLALIDYSNTSRTGVSLLTQLRTLTEPQPVQELEGALAQSATIAKPIAQGETKQPAIAPPSGWRTVTLESGATVYQAPTAITANAATGSTVDSANEDVFSVDALDGTRQPYLTELQPTDLLKHEVAPNQYAWRGMWQGEGYTRELDYEGWLVARQEGGNNVYLSTTYDASVTDPTKPNLFITVESSQDKTAQLTNLSAFLYDTNTGKLVERRDFAQLPPFYNVSMTLNGRTQTKQLRPLGTTTFAYHVAKSDLNGQFPLTMEAVNQLVNERNQQIAALEAEGWVVKEVPAPR